MYGRGGGCTQAECVRALKGLALPRTGHYSEIALAGSHSVACIPRLRQRQSFSCTVLSHKPKPLHPAPLVYRVLLYKAEISIAQFKQYRY
jgi:hypothetical protein